MEQGTHSPDWREGQMKLFWIDLLLCLSMWIDVIVAVKTQKYIYFAWWPWSVMWVSQSLLLYFCCSFFHLFFSFISLLLSILNWCPCSNKLTLNISQNYQKQVTGIHHTPNLGKVLNSDSTCQSTIELYKIELYEKWQGVYIEGK